MIVPVHVIHSEGLDKALLLIDIMSTALIAEKLRVHIMMVILSVGTAVVMVRQHILTAEKTPQPTTSMAMPAAPVTVQDR